MGVYINLLTGKRPSLSETKKFKTLKIYHKVIIKENEYNKFLQLPEQKRKEKINEILKETKPKQTKKTHRNNKLEKAQRIEADKREGKTNKKIRLVDPVIPAGKLKNKNGDILFEIIGIHSKGRGKLEPYLNEYHFYATEKTRNIKYLQVGAIAVVDTNFGVKRIMITKFVKPRSEKRMEEIRKFKHTRRIVPEVWTEQVKKMKRLGKI